MKFSLVDEIPFPRDLVFATLRDKLVDLVPFLPNVDEITCEEREEDGDAVRLFNIWKGASSDIPAALRGFIKPDMLSWEDRATWDQGKWRCDWELTITALPEAVTARGFNEYLDEDDEMVIEMNGEFIIHPDKIPGVPTFVANRMAPTLEKFVVGLVQPNLRKTNKAVIELLEELEGE